MAFTRLTSPISIRGLELKNRMIIPAIHLASTANGACTSRFLHFYRRRALGGAGLIITGSCRFDEYGSDRLSMSLASDEMVAGWKAFTDEIHKLGCPVAVQLFHAGRYVRENDVPCGRPALSPSEGFCRFTRETTPGMTAEQIEALLHAYYLGTKRAIRAGFDAVEISGSSGYLLCQFLSPLINKRTDRYGGSFEKRCRLPLEVLQTVREAAGWDYPVFYRLGADDLVEGSNRAEDLLRFVPLAEKAGADCFNVTGGWHESKVPQLTGDVPRGGLSFLARAVKETVSVPVIANNRINDPVTAERLLALEEADLVGTGRACIADPDFPNKVIEDRVDEIRPCIACNQGCLGNVFFRKPLLCHVNSEAGREWEKAEKEAGTGSEEGSGEPVFRHRASAEAAAGKHILVIGGGPAGCEAALAAAQKGNEVTLLEKTESLGGQLKLAAKLPGKQELKTLIRFYERNLAKAGVRVLLNREYTPDEGFDGFTGRTSFDEIVFACGGRKKKTVLPADSDAVPVVSYEEILTGKVQAGRRVVVIGGSFIGCETARFLAAEASADAGEVFYLTKYKVCGEDKIRKMLETSRRQVTVIEREKKIGYGYEPGTAWPVLADLDYYAVDRLSDTEAVKAAAEGVLIRDSEGFERLIGCDTVVTTFGVEPKEAEAFSAGPDIRTDVIGNARKTGRSMDAIAAGQKIV